MFLAIALLLIQPVTPVLSVQVSISQPAKASASEVETSDVAPAAVTDVPDATVAANGAADRTVTASSASELPSAPTPIMAAPITKPRPLKNATVSVAELLAEGRRNQHIWLGLGIAEHSAAALDAWSTRRAITVGGGHEINPMLKPFAGNSSIYAAIQAWPLLMDYAGKKMMYSRHPWERRMWWVPQSASIIGSVYCVSHNLGIHPVAN